MFDFIFPKVYIIERLVQANESGSSISYRGNTSIFPETPYVDFRNFIISFKNPRLDTKSQPSNDCILLKRV